MIDAEEYCIATKTEMKDLMALPVNDRTNNILDWKDSQDA